MSVPRTVLFVNPFDFDFVGFWDNEPYSCPSGKKMYLPDYLANHLTKHLVDARLNRLQLPTDFRSTDPSNPNMKYSRPTLEKMCIKDEGLADVHSSPTKQEISILNKKDPTHAGTELKSGIEQKPFCDMCDSKGVRHKKDCPNNPHVAALAPDTKEQVESLNA